MMFYHSKREAVNRRTWDSYNAENGKIVKDAGILYCKTAILILRRAALLQTGPGANLIGPQDDKHITTDCGPVVRC